MKTKDPIKDYLSSLGKKSAEKRSHDKRFDREYYSKLGKKSAEAKRKRKKEKERRLKAGEPPLRTITKFIKGDI